MIKVLILLGFIVSWFPCEANGQKLRSARPWMGIVISEGKRGVLVDQVLPKTPALAAGLAKGDEVTHVDDAIIKTPRQLVTEIAKKGVGYSVKVTVVRGEKTLLKVLKLEAKPDAATILEQELLGRKAPKIDLEQLVGGEKLKLTAFAGRPVLLKFWATWCPACRAVQASVESLANKSAGKYQVVTVASQERSELQAYYKSVKPPSYPILIDQGGKIAREYSIPALPTFIVIDKEGVIRFVSVGGGHYFQKAKTALLDLVGQGSQAPAKAPGK